MLHLSRNPSITVPVDVSMYDGFTPLSGEEDNLSGKVMCMDNGYTLDIDGVFKDNPAAPYFSMVPYSRYSNVYQKTLEPSSWPRGHYRAWVFHTTGQAWAYDFTLGLHVEHRVAYAAVYTGTALQMTLWMEELGVAADDVVGFKDVKVTDMAGNVLLDVPFLPPLIGSPGVFTLNADVLLAANQNYTLSATARVGAPATKNEYLFPLKIGLARP